MGAKKTKQDYTKLYEQYREVPLKEWTSRDPVAIANEFKKHDKKTKIDDEHAFGTVYLLAAKVAHGCDVEAFNRFMATQETPPIRLTKEEMKLLKGGLEWGWLAGFGALAAAGIYMFGQSRGQKTGFNKGKVVGYSDANTDQLRGNANAIGSGAVTPEQSSQFNEAVNPYVNEQAGKRPYKTPTRNAGLKIPKG